LFVSRSKVRYFTTDNSYFIYRPSSIGTDIALKKDNSKKKLRRYIKRISI